tara:strand:+ start:703 stop:1521 length:819 start_codon:yes stop_codon:yes gene_type:complete
MHESLVPLAKAGLLRDYHIIIDEVPDVVQSMATKSKTSIDEFYIDTGFMEVDEASGLVRPTQKWIDIQDQVSDTLSPKILSAALSSCLYLQDRQFKEKAAQLIAIEDTPALSKLTFTHTAQQKGSKSVSYCNKVSGSLKNLRGRKLKGVDVKDILVTCMKGAWLKSANDNQLKLGPFAKDSRLGEANWVANTTRGTNNYAHCSHLIYLYDQHPHPFLTRWLGDSSREFADAYALTELVQWVWRSRVRRGEPITLYLPSLRMRRIFEEWLYGA